MTPELHDDIQDPDATITLEEAGVAAPGDPDDVEDVSWPWPIEEPEGDES